MTEQNIALVRSLYAAFGRGEIDTIVNACSPQVRWLITSTGSDHPMLQERHGREGVQDFFRTLAELQDAEEFTPREIHGSGDKVFVLGNYRWKVRATGKVVASDFCHVFTVANQAVAHFQEFADTAQFLEAQRA